MLRNTRSGYGLVAIVLHWTIAVLFIGQAGLGLAMMHGVDQRTAFGLIQWHKSFGLLILGLAVIRLAWRLTGIRPALPTSMPGWEARGARLAHGMLYATLLLLPLTGWALVSVSVLAIPTYAFYLVVVPHLPLAVSEGAEMFWGDVHRLMAWTAIALVIGHVLAALRHRFVLHDDVMARMLRPARKADDSPMGHR
ncbi:MAG: cytochrome b [Rhizobiaceae bacterium]|nr:cytochrome b [Rhizobiaceae bacterium]